MVDMAAWLDRWALFALIGVVFGSLLGRYSLRWVDFIKSYLIFFGSAIILVCALTFYLKQVVGEITPGDATILIGVFFSVPAFFVPYGLSFLIFFMIEERT
jgi:hypothetical protein